MSRLSKIFAFLGIIAIGLICGTGAGYGQDCETTKDWKDIYILPTNPNPQNNIKLTLSAEKKSLKPGEELNLTFTADRECYLTLMDMGTSGKILRLWPNDYSGQDNRIAPNSPRKFPGPGDKFRYRIAGPDGVERLIAYATSEKGKILSEQEFQKLKDTGFKEYPGSAKDLAIQFQSRADSLGSGISWGTAQENVCIGSGPKPSVDLPTSSKVYVMSVAAQTGKLKYCNKNAQTITDTLQAKLGLDKSNARVLIDGAGDYQGFCAGIQWLASVTRPEDKVIIYYSGHGGSCKDRPPIDEEDGRDEFLVLYPGQKEGMTLEQCLRKKICLIDDEINVLVKKIPARKKIFIIDSCHSGTMSKDIVGDDDLVSMYQPMIDPQSGKEDLGFGQKATPPNYGNDHEAVLSACLDNETSWESWAPSIQAGLFTHFLLEAINGGSPNLEHAFKKAKENVLAWGVERSRKTGKPFSQTPCLTDPHRIANDLRFEK